MNLEKFYQFVKDKPFYVIMKTDGSAYNDVNVDSDNLGALWYIGERIENEVDVYWFENGGYQSTSYTFKNVVSHFEDGYFMLKELYGENVNIEDAVEHLTGFSTDNLFESEEPDFSWVEDLQVNIDPKLKIGANFRIRGMNKNLILRIVGIESRGNTPTSDGENYEIIYRAFNDHKNFKWNDHTESTGLEWANKLVDPNQQNHWLPISNADAEKIIRSGNLYKKQKKKLKESDDFEWAKDIVDSAELKVDYQTIVNGAKVVRGEDWEYGYQEHGAVYGILMTTGHNDYMGGPSLYSELDYDENDNEYDQWWCQVKWVDAEGNQTHQNQYRVGPVHHDLNYYIGDTINETEDDGLEWARDIVNTNNLLKGKAFHIILDGSQKQFIEVQRWLFSQGFKWQGGSLILDKRSGITSIQSVFRDSIKDSKITRSKQWGVDDSQSEINSHYKDELIVLDWSEISPTIIKESDKEFDWLPEEPNLNNPEDLFNVLRSFFEGTEYSIEYNGETYKIKNGRNQTLENMGPHSFKLENLQHMIFKTAQWSDGHADDVRQIYRDLYSTLTPLFKLMSPKLNESEEADFSWIEELPNETNWDVEIKGTIDEEDLQWDNELKEAVNNWNETVGAKYNVSIYWVRGSIYNVRDRYNDTREYNIELLLTNECSILIQDNHCYFIDFKNKSNSIPYEKKFGPTRYIIDPIEDMIPFLTDSVEKYFSGNITESKNDLTKPPKRFTEDDLEYIATNNLDIYEIDPKSNVPFLPTDTDKKYYITDDVSTLYYVKKISKGEYDLCWKTRRKHWGYRDEELEDDMFYEECTDDRSTEELIKNFNSGRMVIKSMYNNEFDSFDAFEKLYESSDNDVNQEDDNLEWARDAISVTPLKNQAWHITLRNKQDFIDVQKWLFEQGFTWGGNITKIKEKSDAISVQSVFGDNIAQQTFTFSERSNFPPKEDMWDSARIANKAGKDMMIVFKWPNMTPKFIQTEEYKNLNESEDDGLEWAREVVNQPLKIPARDDDYYVLRLKKDTSVEEVEIIIHQLIGMGWNMENAQGMANSLSHYSRTGEAYIFLRPHSDKSARGGWSFGSNEETFRMNNRKEFKDVTNIFL